MQTLCNVIHQLSGKHYGYLVHDLADTLITCCTMTLCKDRTISKAAANTIDTTIRAWALGAGFGEPRVVWPDFYA